MVRTHLDPVWRLIPYFDRRAAVARSRRSHSIMNRIRPVITVSFHGMRRTVPPHAVPVRDEVRCCLP